MILSARSLLFPVKSRILTESNTIISPLIKTAFKYPTPMCRYVSTTHTCWPGFHSVQFCWGWNDFKWINSQEMMSYISIYYLHILLDIDIGDTYMDITRTFSAGTEPWSALIQGWSVNGGRFGVAIGMKLVPDSRNVISVYFEYLLLLNQFCSYKYQRSNAGGTSSANLLEVTSFSGYTTYLL